MNARLRIFPKKRSGNQDLKKVHQTNSNPGPHDHQPNTLTTRLPTVAAESTENLSYLCASPNPDPNHMGGGQLPNPNECNSTLTSGTKNIYP